MALQVRMRSDRMPNESGVKIGLPSRFSTPLCAQNFDRLAFLLTIVSQV